MSLAKSPAKFGLVEFVITIHSIISGDYCFYDKITCLVGEKMQIILNEDTVLINISLPESIESSIDWIESFVEKEQKYLMQVLLMLLVIITLHRVGMI